MEASTAAVDGRSARAQRTRAKLIQAHFELLEEGELRPTSEQIAERAGCSPRSVFKHFPDRESFLAAVAEAQHERVTSQLDPLPEGGPLDERLDAFVAQRARILEYVTPVRRSALLMEPFSELVASWLAFARRSAGEEVERAFGPEIAARPEAERDELRAALVAAAAWPTWESLRRHQGLDPAAAERAMRRTLAALLAG